MTLDIILVEDNALNYELVRDLLEVSGHRIRLAESGAQFRAIFGTGAKPDLVLMDILLPDTDGVTLLGEIRSSPYAEVPVIALTAQAGAADRSRFVSAGFDAIITKPIDTRSFSADILKVALAKKAVAAE